MADSKVSLSDFHKFRNWHRKQYGIWATLQANYQRATLGDSSIYQWWVSQDKPEEKVTQTVEERTVAKETMVIGGIRKSVLPTGAIPWKGNELNQVRLEGLNYELIKSDEFGVLPEDSWFFQKKAEVSPTTGVDLSTLPMVVPISGQGYKETWWDRATNTYYTQDALGKAVKITGDDAVKFRNLYLAETEGTERAWLPPEKPEPTIAQQQWGISKNRREWAAGVNIEQDIITGKLYRPDSMVEVSPDIATQELQAYQTAQEKAGKPDWQEALEREKFAWTKEQAGLKPEVQRQIDEAQWEKDRYSLLQGIAPDDWITRYMMENQPNPYKAQTPDTAMADLEKGLDARTADVQYRQQILSGAIMGGADDDTIAKLKDLRDQASAKRDVYYDAWNKQKTEQRDWTPQPYPNAPAWLSKYALGQVAGKMITPEDVVTPSGQQFTQMPTTEASRLGYYADWSQKLGGGRNWKDILGEMRLMQPETPRGAGSFGWSPAGR